MKKYLAYLLLFLVLTIFHRTSIAEDYYWVGGQGSWSDLNHWQTADGQIPNEVPDPTDNVIFNGDSFLAPYDTIFILTGNPTCKDFTVTGLDFPVVFRGGSSITAFSVYGSWLMHDSAVNDYTGKIKFMSIGNGRTITCSGVPFAGDIWFEGSGEWILQDTLLVIDTSDWKLILQGIEPAAWPNPRITHNNGRLDANGQTIITRGFSTIGEDEREFNMKGTSAYVFGDWNLSAAGLDFMADSSYIYLRGNMNNYQGNGTEVYYRDVDVSWPEGKLVNTDVRTHMRKVHFLGGGKVEGNKTEGSWGMFTIDTLIMEGAIIPTGPVGNEISANYSDIHYTLFKMTTGTYRGDHGLFHRLDDSCYMSTGRFTGRGNTIDSIHFFIPKKAVISGSNTINHLAYFRHEGVLDTYLNEENSAAHVIINGDGWILGTNAIDLLTLNSGYWYRFGVDSMYMPGGVPPLLSYVTLGGLEVTGSCDHGLTFLSSEHKETTAFIDFTGENLQTEYLAVKDIHNVGNTIQLDNSIDLGDNTGFDFDSPETRTLYWVGGGGDWSDIGHWSLADGGAGGECPPTPLDDIFFTPSSGFADSGAVVNIDVKYACCKDFTWLEVENLPAIVSDTNDLRVWGSFITNRSMQFLVYGNVYFESEDDEEYLPVIIEWGLAGDSGDVITTHKFHRQVHFWGLGGKWRLDSRFEAYNDTTFLSIGELLLEDDTMSVHSFIANDTLPKGMYMLGRTLVTLHGYAKNGWLFNAYKYVKDDPAASKTWWDAGRSTIRSVGQITPPPLSPPGLCDIMTTGDDLDYYNIEFGDTSLVYASSWGNTAGRGSRLISSAHCTYNLVDYYITEGQAYGWADIDTLTWHRKTLENGITVSADRCIIRNIHNINFLFAESVHDTLIMSGGRIDTAFFYNDGGLWGWHDIGYLEGHKDMSLDLFNKVDTALLMGNTHFRGKNTFSQLVLSSGKKYSFQHDTGKSADTTTITDDWIVTGLCDEPIRLQSDSTGTQAKIDYQAANPGNPDFTANFTSIKDIWLLGDETFTAINSVDLGNNTNWEFTNSGSEVYYWVGGQGKWGDWSHWSTESGGEPVPGKCVPKEINTVVFDDNSFLAPGDTVFIDVRNAYCRDMYWIHSPEVFTPVFTAIDSAILYVYGSLLLNESMDYQYRGQIFFDELNAFNITDTITTKGHVLLNDIRFQGIGDVVVLGDDLELADDMARFNIVYLEHGEFRTDGYQLKAEGLYSTYKNPRTLDIANSKVTLTEEFSRVWKVNGTNLSLNAEKSRIINQGFASSIYTLEGNFLQFNDIVLEGGLDSLFNTGNTCGYNEVHINKPWGLVAGNFTADSVYLRGEFAGMHGHSATNVVTLDSMYCSVNDNHIINRCVVNRYGIIRGTNDFGYCIFHDDGVFKGTNEFDTLVLFPGWGSIQGQGNWFFFEAGQEQIIYDSLYLRGNPCSNISIASLGAPALAWLRKDNGIFDVSCDYLNIISVGAVSENLTFYAGLNSTALPDPNDPPPGWVFDNAQGYIYGFNGLTAKMCEGETIKIDANSFNGGANTLYYWADNPVPGDLVFEVTAPGTYNLHVAYGDNCFVDDYIVVEEDQPPVAVLDGGPFCEGDEIGIQVSPADGTYTYEWWNGETTPTIIADPSYNGEIYVAVVDVTNNCKARLEDKLFIKPAPVPQVYLGPETWIKHQETITLDAGPGDMWEWSSDPVVNIGNPFGRTITVMGFDDPNPVTYHVLVEQDGCTGEGQKTIGMYPPSKLGVPTAFSPNGDGDNDELKVLGTGFSEMDFRIFDRYGQVVFETTDPNEGWDGTAKGVKQEMEVYTYYLRVRFEDSSVEEEKGNITLLR